MIIEKTYLFKYWFLTQNLRDLWKVNREFVKKGMGKIHLQGSLKITIYFDSWELNYCSVFNK